MNLKERRALKKRLSRGGIIELEKSREITEEIKGKIKGISDLNKYFEKLREFREGMPLISLHGHPREEAIRLRGILRSTNKEALKDFIRFEFERFEPLHTKERIRALEELKNKIDQFNIPPPPVSEDSHPGTKRAVSKINKQASRVVKKEVIKEILDPEIKKLERLLKPKSRKEVKPVKLPFHPKKDPFLDMARNIFRFNASKNQIPELRRLLRKSRRKGLSEEVLRLLDEQARKSGYRDLLLPLFMDERKKLTEIEKKFFGIE